jgi:thermitase
MRRLLTLLTVLFACSALLSNHSYASAQRRFGSIGTESNTRFLVKFKPGISPEVQQATVQKLGGQIRDRLDSISVTTVDFEQRHSHGAIQLATDLISTLDHDPNVVFVEPDVIYSITNEVEPQDKLAHVMLPLIQAPPLPVISNEFIPNDTDLRNQYALSRINAFPSWALTQGDPKIVVAVIDTGVQLNHPDLRNKLVAGYDFVGKDGVPDTIPNDENGHGTHVAGIAAAATNNSLGIAGACPKCRIMPIRVLDAQGNGYLSDIARGIDYAINNGANVINLSLTGPDSNTMAAMVARAWNKGAFIACAAGNDQNQYPLYTYPARYETCMGVASTTKDDLRSSFSNYGSWVEVAAPGSWIYSTWNNGGYNSINGTSMATPYVAGMAGLVMSQGLTNQQAREKICKTADPIAETGTSWRCGRINMHRAVSGS